ncbi:MAG: phosphorylase [Rhodothalassiaceae bacterium]
MSRLGIVTGLRFEADTLVAARRRAGIAADRILIETMGPGRARARRAAQSLIDRGCDAILSMGLAGGLEPGLSCGDIVLIETVLGPQSRPIACDPELIASAVRLMNDGPSFRQGILLDAVAPVTTIGAKRALYRDYRALAVDMESYGAAEAAAAAKVPFLSLRVIGDPADQEIPVIALLGMREDGSVDPLRVLGGALKSPSALPGLLRLGKQSKRAMSVLGRLGEILFSGGL